MAQVTITIPDTVVPRILAAFGHFNADTGMWVNATNQQVLSEVKNFLKGQVSSYETRVAAQAKSDSVSVETW